MKRLSKAPFVFTPQFVTGVGKVIITDEMGKARTHRKNLGFIRWLSFAFCYSSASVIEDK